MQSKQSEDRPAGGANNTHIRVGSRVREKGNEGARGTVIVLGTEARGRDMPGSNSTAVLARGLTSLSWKYWARPAQMHSLFRGKQRQLNSTRHEVCHG